MLSVTRTREIEWGDCDPAGIVFNPRYFAFFDHATTQLYAEAGWPKPVLLKTFGIVGCPLVETGAKFLAPCAWGDEVTITSTVTEVGRSSFGVRHQLFKGELLCVDAAEKRVWTVRRPDSGLIQSAPIPQEVVDRFTR